MFKGMMYMKKTDDILIEELEFSFRTQHYLNYKKINTLGDLKKYSLEDLYKIRKTPRKVVEEIVEKAKEYGIVFEVNEKND